MKARGMHSDRYRADVWVNRLRATSEEEGNESLSLPHVRLVV